MPARRQHVPGGAGLTLVVTCEHATRRVPPRWRKLFRGHEALLTTHRGYDPGALELAQRLARHFEAPLLCGAVTRLLIELNRSLHHPRVFSEVSRGLPRIERQRLVEEHHRPHWLAVEAAVRAALEVHPDVLHLGVHTFTPVLDGEERRADVAVLYDSRRPRERRLAARWCEGLRHALPALRIRRNYPYRGNADGLVTAFRRRLPARRYLAFELEVSQRFLEGPRGEWREVQAAIETTLADIVGT